MGAKCAQHRQAVSLAVHLLRTCMQQKEHLLIADELVIAFAPL